MSGHLGLRGPVVVVLVVVTSSVRVGTTMFHDRVASAKGERLLWLNYVVETTAKPSVMTMTGAAAGVTVVVAKPIWLGLVTVLVTTVIPTL